MRPVAAVCDNDLTRETVMKQAANIRALKLPVLPPGIAISTGARRLRPHQADADREIRRQYLAAFRRGALRLRRLAL